MTYLLPTPERLHELVDRIAGVPLLVVGDLLADAYLIGRTSRISREAPVLILKRSGERTVPGQAANTAANAAALGARVILAGALGDDRLGRDLTTILEDQGVELHSTVVPQGRTLSKLRVLAGGSHTTVQQVIRIDDDEGLELPSNTATALRNGVSSVLDAARAVVVCDYGYGVVDDQLWTHLLAHRDKTKTPLILDSRYRLTSFRGASQITPNEEEGLAVCGFESIHQELDLSQVGKCLFERTAAESVLLTRGNEGMVLYGGDGDLCVLPVFGPKDCRDVTGAGDTVAATNAAAQAVGASLVEAAILANIAGAQVVQKVGTATTSRQEMHEAILAAYADWASALH
jgi:rfaE bifunctional protein kinase chain/domain